MKRAPKKTNPKASEMHHFINQRVDLSLHTKQTSNLDGQCQRLSSGSSCVRCTRDGMSPVAFLYGVNAGTSNDAEDAYQDMEL